MFSLTTKYGNTLNLADCIMNSLEVESPFLSFHCEKLKYNVSYFLENKDVVAEYYGNNEAVANLFLRYWEEHGIAEMRINLALENEKPVTENTDAHHGHFTIAATAILQVMDEYSMMAEKLIAA